MLIEEERNDEFIEQLHGNNERRESEYRLILQDIQKLSDEIRDAKRFQVYN